jgi:hypothetical protein
MFLLGGMVSSAFLKLSKTASFYGRNLGPELGFDSGESSGNILKILQQKPVQDIVDLNNFYDYYLVDILHHLSLSLTAGHK